MKDPFDAPSIHPSIHPQTRLAKVRSRLITVRARLTRFYLRNSTLVYQPTLFKNNLSVKKLVVIMLIYIFFLRWFSGERCVGLGGCVWVIGWAMGIRGRPPSKFKKTQKTCGRQCESYPNSPT